MRWLFVHFFQIELEFRSVDFCGERKTGKPGEKPSKYSLWWPLPGVQLVRAQREKQSAKK